MNPPKLIERCVLRMFKKTLILALSLVMLTMVGCGKSTTEQVKTTDQAKTTEQSQPAANKVIALSSKSLNYYAFVGMSEGVKRAAEKAGYTVKEAVAEFDSAKQNNQFLNFVAEKPVGIILNPTDSDGIISAMQKATDAKIPMAVFDNPTSGGKVDFTISFDNNKAGVMAAQEIIQRLKAKYGTEKGVVLNAYGAMTSSAWRARREGMTAEFKKYPNITYLEVPAEGDIVKTQNAALNAIAKYGDKLDAVHAPSDNPAMGLYEALKQSNMLKKVGEPGHVIFVTIDAEPIALQRITEGYYDATINQDCIAYGELTFKMLTEYSLQGKQVPLGTYKDDNYYWKEAPVIQGPAGPQMVLSPYVIDKSNTNDPKHWANVAWNKYGLRYK